MKLALGALVFMAVAACSSSGDATSGASPSPSSRQDSSANAIERWADTQENLRQAATGRVSIEVRLSEPNVVIASMSGWFDLTKGTIELSTRVRGQGGAQRSSETRVTSDQTGYLRKDTWSGPWSNCWLPVDAGEVAAQDTAIESGKAPALVATSAVRDIRSPDDVRVSEGGEVGAELDAYSALRLLGYSTKELASIERALQPVEVPVTLTLHGSLYVDVVIDGADLMTALDNAGVRIARKASDEIRNQTVHLEVDDIGTPADVPVPNADLLLPRGAERKDACPANR